MPAKIPRVFEIMKDVDRALPEYGRGVVRPQEMAETRTANCFGRLAVVGSQLIEEGLPSERLGWLISFNHGMEFIQDKPWLGHAMLTVKGRKPRLIDATNHTHARRLATTSWRPTNEPSAPVIDYMVLKGMLRDLFLPAEDKRPEQPLYHLRRRAMQGFFSQHRFHEGIAFYQVEHPRLRTPEPLAADDYTNFYAQLSSIQLVDQADLAA